MALTQLAPWQVVFGIVWHYLNCRQLSWAFNESTTHINSFLEYLSMIIIAKCIN